MSIITNAILNSPALINNVQNTDSYKYSHYLQLPPGAQAMSGYVEARGCDDVTVTKSLWFGIQSYLKEYLSKPITMEEVEEANEMVTEHGEPFNLEGFKRIVNVHGGYFPVEIEAVPEGTIVPLKNMLLQAHNTDDTMPWASLFLETAVLRAGWYGTTTATNSWYIKQDLLEYAKKSGAVEGVEFKLHDFGARGVSSNESAMIGDLGHLVNFRGTDTIGGIVGGRRWYDCRMAGYSIPAAEHSTITAWGENGEVDAYRNMLKQFGQPGKTFAVVSDSNDIYYAAREIWGGILKDEVIKSGATVVVRPDSGDPVQVPIDVINILMDKYGFEVNAKGYKTLPSCIRVIQGDGINRQSIQKILANLDMNKLSLDNMAFGMGGAMLQHDNRDTLQFAMKGSAIKKNDEWSNIWKNPVTDPGKKSKAGRLGLYRNDAGEYSTRQTWDGIGEKISRTVWKNGELLVDDSLDTIRERAEAA